MIAEEYNDMVIYPDKVRLNGYYFGLRRFFCSKIENNYLLSCVRQKQYRVL